MNENIKYDLFDDYTKAVTKKILSRKKTAEVRDELFSHLIEEYERFRGLGKSHTEAQEQTINLMGDKKVIAEQFGQLYSISPSDYLGSAFTYLIFGMLLSSFQFDFFTGAREIVLFIGQAILLFALTKLRKADKMMDVAAKLCGGKYLCIIVYQVIAMLLPDSHDFILSFNFINIAFNLVLYGVIFVGIYNLFGKLEKEVKMPNLLLGYIFYFLYSAALMAGIIYNGGDGSILLYIIPVFLAVTIVVVMKSQLALCSRENEIELTGIATTREKVICWVLVTALAIIPAISMVALSCFPTKTSAFEISDTTESAESITSARENMLKLGFPETYLADLPDSEVLRYKEALHLEINERNEQKNVNYYGKNKFSYTIQTFVFYFPQGEMRTLMRLELPDDSLVRFRNGLYYKFGDGFLGDNGKSNFHLALSEKDTKTVSSKILSTYKEENYGTYYEAGFEFKFPNGSTNRRAYLAKNAMVTHPTTHRLYYLDAIFVFEEFPIKTELQSINSTVSRYFNHGYSIVELFGSFTRETVNISQLGESIEYAPEWAGYAPDTEE